MRNWAWAAIVAWGTAGGAGAQAPSAKKFAPPKSNAPDETTAKAIAAKTAELRKAIDALRRQGVRDPWLADVEIFENAARAIVQHDEFYHKDSGAWTLDTLDKGLLRARMLSTGDTPWARVSGQSVVRGYRSRVDGSAQPYAVAYPPEFGKSLKKWRTDVVLHGRDSTITEVKFLKTHADKPCEPRSFVQIDVFGRGNNAYRWAGEADVLEATAAYFASHQGTDRSGLVDASRIVLRGFSMGGAGSWHLGLHHPDKWCVVGPGAGFTTTHGYIAGLPNPLPEHQERCLKIYDAVEYAENGFNVPVVAYSGALDPQKQAADLVEARFKKHGLPMVHLVAPDQEHRFPPDWFKKADALWAEHAKKGREPQPSEIRFVTYTLKYAVCAWVEVLALDRHYDRTLVQAKRTGPGAVSATTANVRRLKLGLEPGAPAEVALAIDGQTLKATPWDLPDGSSSLFLEKRAGTWTSVWPLRLIADGARQPQKVRGLQGPIDDAFADAFLCVRGSGTPWHEATEKYAQANLARFEAEWAKWMRGKLPVKADVDVTAEDVLTKHLVVFGDPSSNTLLAQAVDALPLTWSAKEIRFAGKAASAADHVPVMIQPNPLNPSKYLVVNSGHTFHAAEFKGTNAQLYPRLGDYALLRLAPTASDPLAVEPALAGLFDEHWRLPK